MINTSSKLAFYKSISSIVLDKTTDALVAGGRVVLSAGTVAGIYSADKTIVGALATAKVLNKGADKMAETIARYAAKIAEREADRKLN